MSDTFEITLEVNPSLQQYFLQDRASDIIIRAQTPFSQNPSNKAYKLQKGYLYIESDYFQEVFKNNPQQKEILLKLDDTPVLETILKCFYGFECNIEKKNIFEALDICDYLKIETLQNQILDYMQEKAHELDIVKVWIKSQKLKNRNLEEACIKIFKQQEYALFRNQNSYQSTTSNNLKLEFSLMPSSPVYNIILMNPEHFKKAIQSQGSDFPFLKRKNVFDAIKFYCEKKFESNRDGQNAKICKMTYDLIDPNQCSSEEYKEIFCQQIFHNYNNHHNKSTGNSGSISSDPFRQSFLLQSQLFNNFSQTPINQKGFFNHYQTMQRFSGSNALSPSPYFTKSNYLIGGNVPASPNAFLFNGASSQVGGESLLFLQSTQNSLFGKQPLEDRSEKLNNTFDALKESYQNFMKMSSSSQLGDRSVIESCEQQIETLEEKMQRLLEEKKLKVSVLDEGIKKVDDYIIEQKKKHNMISMLNSNVLDDINNMLISNNQSNQSVHQSTQLFNSQLNNSNQIQQSMHVQFNLQNEDLKEVERQIHRKNTFQRLMNSNSSDNQDKGMLVSDTIPERPRREEFNIEDNPFISQIESDNDDDNQPDDDDDDNDDNNKMQQQNIQEEDESDDDFSDAGDVDIDEMMNDIDEFEYAPKNLQLYSNQTAMKTPHIKLEEIANSVQMINNIQPENIEISNDFRLNQSNTHGQIYFYEETESGSHDYRKFNHQSAIRQKPQAIFNKK